MGRRADENFYIDFGTSIPRKTSTYRDDAAPSQGTTICIQRDRIFDFLALMFHVISVALEFPVGSEKDVLTLP